MRDVVDRVRCRLLGPPSSGKQKPTATVGFDVVGKYVGYFVTSVGRYATPSP